MGALASLSTAREACTQAVYVKMETAMEVRGLVTSDCQIKQERTIHVDG